MKTKTTTTPTSTQPETKTSTQACALTSFLLFLLILVCALRVSVDSVAALKLSVAALSEDHKLYKLYKLYNSTTVNSKHWPLPTSLALILRLLAFAPTHWLL